MSLGSVLDKVRGADSQPAPDHTIDVESALHVLSNSRRRHVVRILDQRGQVPLRELSTEVAARELDKHYDTVARQERKRVYIALHQTHLPTMDGERVAAYDEREKTVVATDLTSALANALDSIENTSGIDAGGGL